MNKERRKQIESIVESIQGIKSDVDTTKDEEQEYLDNLPENMQQGEKGETAQAAVDALDAAINSLDDAISSLEEAAQ